MVAEKHLKPICRDGATFICFWTNGKGQPLGTSSTKFNYAPNSKEALRLILQTERDGNFHFN